MSAPLTPDSVVPVSSPEMGLAQQQPQQAPLNLTLRFPQGSEFPLRNPKDSISSSESSFAL